jgi:predicted dehydrogenase
MMIEDGRLGSLSRIMGFLGGGRAMMFRNGTHMIDTVCYYAEAEPAWLIGEMEEGYENYTEYKGDGGHDPKTEPGASAYIHFANGIRGHLEISRRMLSGLGVELVCEKGRIRIDGNEAVVYLQSENRRGEVTSRQIGGRMVYRGLMLAAVEELVELIENGGESISSGREALRGLEIMTAIMRSQAQGAAKVHWPLAR